MTAVIVIDLVYDADCPNVDRAREVIAAALREAGVPGPWREWDRVGDDTPARLRDFGSPTVLVNGRDVSATPTDDTRAAANCCRVYQDESGRLSGVPTTGQIVRAISRGQGS